MVIGFRPMFVGPILNNIKIHTLREDAHNRWRPNMQMHMATGVRSRNYVCFCDKHRCISTQKAQIIIDHTSQQGVTAIIDGRTLTESETLQLAINDGFTSIAGFRLWFIDGFDGKLIHWTNFKY